MRCCFNCEMRASNINLHKAFVPIPTTLPNHEIALLNLRRDHMSCAFAVHNSTIKENETVSKIDLSRFATKAPRRKIFTFNTCFSSGLCDLVANRCFATASFPGNINF